MIIPPPVDITELSFLTDSLRTFFSLSLKPFSPSTSKIQEISVPALLSISLSVSIKLKSKALASLFPISHWTHYKYVHKLIIYLRITTQIEMLLD